MQIEFEQILNWTRRRQLIISPGGESPLCQTTETPWQANSDATERRVFSPTINLCVTTDTSCRDTSATEQTHFSFQLEQNQC